MTRPRILFLNRSFWPDSEATGQLLTQLCEDLLQDFDIDVICGHPLQGEKVQDDVHPFGPSLNIHRVNHTRFAKGSFVGRLLNLVSFTICANRALKKVQTPDVVITETDPFFLPLLGVRLKKKKGCKFIAYLQDIYPDVAVALGKVREGIIVRKIRSVLFNCYRKADRVLVLSDDMQQTCLAHGVSKTALTVIPNWTDTTKITPIKQNNPLRRAHRWNEKFLVMYSGNLGLAHELNAMLETAKILQSQDKIHFVIIGEGVQKEALIRKTQELELVNVSFLDKQPYEKLAESLSAADLHYVSLKKGAEHCLFPSKIYGILASGTPLLVLAAGESELSRFIIDEKLGSACEIDQPEQQVAESLAQKILALSENKNQLQQMGTRARQLAISDFDRRVITGKFARYVRETISCDSIQLDQLKLDASRKFNLQQKTLPLETPLEKR